MKRKAALIIIILITAVTTFISVKATDYCTENIKESAEVFIKGYSNDAKLIDELSLEFDKYKSVLYLFTDHSLVNEVSDRLNNMQYYVNIRDNYALKEEYYHFISALKKVKEDQSIINFEFL